MRSPSFARASVPSKQVVLDDLQKLRADRAALEASKKADAPAKDAKAGKTDE